MRYMKLAVWGVFHASYILALGTSSIAQAQVYMTPTGSTTSGGIINAEADFTLSNGKIVVVLKNLLSNPKADSQLLNGISFGVSGATTSGNLFTVNSGLISTINGDGTYTSGVSDTLARWQATETGTNINLTTLTGGKPNELIIGPDSKGNFTPSLGGEYTNANSSITQHNPSILGTGMFTISVTGVTNTSKLSNVVFGFGTAAGTDTVAGRLTSVTPSDVPEPGSIALLTGMGLSTAAFLYRRKKTSKAD